MGASDPKKLDILESVTTGAKESLAPGLHTAAADTPRAFSRIPTHAIGVVPERRFHARAALQLPLRLVRVNDDREPVSISLLTRNISTSGVFFLAPKKIEIGAAIELEVGLVHRPLGYGNVRMATCAHVARIEEVPTPGWYGIGAQFDEIAFDRDEPVPVRFKP
jgi:hypothetical protein